MLGSVTFPYHGTSIYPPPPPRQRRASRLLHSGRAQSRAEAELASELMALRFPAEDSLQAASQCSGLYAAVSFLHQECELCAGRYSAREVSGSPG